DRLWRVHSISLTFPIGGGAEFERASASIPRKMPGRTREPGTYRGAWQILVFNWPFYALACAVDVLATVLLWFFRLPPSVRALMYIAAGTATFWAVSSLLVSHYVYDLSALYQWDWLATILKRNPRRWANIHAGFDQTSFALTQAFPGTQPRILDIYSRF